MYRLDNSSLASVTSEELRWLDVHATILCEESPISDPMPGYQRSTKSSTAKSIPKRPDLQSVPTFPSQEWIYRSPKSPSGTSTPPRKRPLPNPPSLCNQFSDSQSSSGSPFPTKFWTAPSRSSSKSLAKEEANTIPSLWFGASDCRASPKSKRTGLSTTSSISPPTPRRPLKPRPKSTRSGSISSVSSSASAMSSPPHTPTTPSKTLNFKKFEPHHRCIVECDEGGEDGGMMRGSPTKGILSPPRLHSRSSSTRANTRSGRKISTATTSSSTTNTSLSSSLSSSKSVKFVDTPIVHYASGVRFSYGDYNAEYEYGPKDGYGCEVGYGEDWGGDPFRNYMSVDDDEGRHLRTHPYARVTGVVDEEDEETDDSEDADGIATEDEEDEDDGTQFQEFLAQAREATEARESLCKTPTPDSLRNSGQCQTQSPSSLRRLVSLKRRSSTSSNRTTVTTTRSTLRPASRPKAQSTTNEKKPVISGPYVLGSLSRGSPPGVRSAPALRATPSVESFKSGKSAGVKSVKSMRSLKSLPESVKSTISLRAKGMRDWFKGRVSIGG